MNSINGNFNIHIAFLFYTLSQIIRKYTNSFKGLFSDDKTKSFFKVSIKFMFSYQIIFSRSNFWISIIIKNYDTICLKFFSKIFLKIFIFKKLFFRFYYTPNV